MNEPSKAEVDWYINWYNNLPVSSTPKPERWGTRGFCKGCKQPLYVKLNEQAEVVVALDHTADCKLWNDYKKEHAID